MNSLALMKSRSSCFGFSLLAVNIFLHPTSNAVRALVGIWIGNPQMKEYFVTGELAWRIHMTSEIFMRS